MNISQRITPCLWFDTQAEEAANFYVSIFRNSKIGRITRYGKAGFEEHQKPAGSVMEVDFELDGQSFTALNGGPDCKFNEAISLQINCDTQEEVDYYWQKLLKGDHARALQCGWLKDRYGVSWQVVPTMLTDLFEDHESEKAQRAMDAMLKMTKIDIAELEHAVGSHARA
jgi:predicted 3-demethylubiquinone-9 3-methyltransferase (glyoxalase superfamily)